MTRARADRVSDDRRDGELRPATARATPPLQAQVAQLQRSAGNRAVSQLIARNGGGTGTATPRKPRMVRRKEVDREVQETISHAPAAFSAWEGTYKWRAKWRLKLDMRDDSAELNVKVRLYSTASRAIRHKWSRAIRKKWSGKFGFYVEGVDGGDELYPINVGIEWVDDPAKAHYTITPNVVGATASGRAGLGGTISMEGWGETDTVDVTHEFGHILGCPEEYFTTNGVDYSKGGTRQGFRDPGGGVMNNPAGPALARNFKMIRTEAAKLRGVKYRQTKIVPWTP